MSVFDVFHMLRARRDVETQLGLLRAMKTTQERVARLEKDMREVIAAIGSIQDRVNDLRGSVTTGAAYDDVVTPIVMSNDDMMYGMQSERGENDVRAEYSRFSSKMLIETFDTLPGDEKFWALVELLDKRGITYMGFRLSRKNLRNVRNALQKARIPLEQFAKDPS